MNPVDSNGLIPISPYFYGVLLTQIIKQNLYRIYLIVRLEGVLHGTLVLEQSNDHLTWRTSSN